MTKSNSCEIVVVLDRSGSMDLVRVDMENGFNSFIARQKQVPGECTVSLTQFDTVFEDVYQGKDLKDVPPLQLMPRGMTALYDAVGKTIAAVGERLLKTNPDLRSSKVLFMVITDGQENASHEYNAERVKKMIAHQRDKYSWEFVFLGSDITTNESAHILGIYNVGNYVNSSQGVQALFSCVSSSAAKYRAGNAYVISTNIPEDQSGNG